MPSTQRQVTEHRRTTIGLFTHGAGDPNSEAVWAGVQGVARERDVNLICFPGKPLRSPHGYEAQSNAVFELAGPENVDALVIWSGALSHRVDPAVIGDFCKRYSPLPIVSIGDPLVEGVPGIVMDNYHGMRDVVTHLVEFHNLSRVAFIRGPELQPEAEQRYRAYRDVLAEHGIPLDPDLVVTGNFKESGGAAAVGVLLDEREARFDGLVAASDNMAIGAIKALQERGVQVPGQIKVAGLNDEEQGRFITPPLTTAPFRSYAMARRACEMLLARLDGEEVPTRTALPSRLLIRESCGCPAPLVVAAGQAGVSTQHESLRAALATRRAIVLADMGEGWDNVPDGAAAIHLANLLDSFVAEATGEGQGAFLEALTSALQAPVNQPDAFARWQSAVSALRRQALPYLRDRAALVRAENLWAQARLMIGETGQRARAYVALRAQNETRLLAEVNQRLSNAIDRADLELAIAHALPKLGIGRCLVALYQSGPGSDGTALPVIVSVDGQSAQAGAAPQPFPVARLAPPCFLPADRRYSVVVEPLYFREEQLGFLVLEAEPQQEETCEILREQIAGAVKRIQLYRAATDAREVAEEGRRLAEAADRLKSHFLATVSHELRTPLSLIVGTVEMMLKPAATGESSLPESSRRDLATIRTGAQHLAHLISDVLDLASSQAGELRLHYGPVPLATVLGHAALLGRRMAEEKGLQWRADLPANLPTISGDRTRLQQVVLNLISNAVKFTEAGTVTLCATVEGGEVTISVADTGVGIPPAEQLTIFDEFRQSSRTAVRGYGGIGLGLAISRRLVELHCGRIRVESSGYEGQGSRFSFTLPLTADLPDLTGVSPAWAGPVLVLTGQPGQARRLVENVEGRGYPAIELACAEDCDWIKQVKAHSPGAVIVDGDLAGELAWSLLEALRNDAGTQDIPLLLYSLPPDRETGSVLELDYLRKPIASGELARALERREVGAGPLVLIVEDDPCIMDLHSRMVAEHMPAARVLQARNGREALSALQAYHPDLILLDLMMPEVDGFEVLETMQGMPTVRDIPVIVLTARSLTPEDMSRLRGGVTGVLGKGMFTAAEVLAQIELALSRSKRLAAEPQRIVRRVMGYLHEHYAQPVRSDELARLAGLSERHLNRCFSQETGMTPMKYLHRYRIKQAKALLEQNELAITEVALAVGFAEHSHFTRAFREEVGTSPSAYRRGASKAGGSAVAG